MRVSEIRVKRIRVNQGLGVVVNDVVVVTVVVVAVVVVAVVLLRDMKKIKKYF